MSSFNHQLLNSYTPQQLEPIAELIVSTSIADFIIKANRVGISHLTLLSNDHSLATNTLSSLQNSAANLLLAKAETQLQQYVKGKLKEFDLPLAPTGTAFQYQVWQHLLQIPYGHTASYGDIAAAIGKPKAARAVGRANGMNPIALIIPCHRVIGKNKTLTGYALGLELKQILLNLENV